MAIEVEKRGLLTKAHYDRLGGSIIALGGVDLGENNTQTEFYLSDKSQAKVQHAISKGSAKIAWKSGGNDGASAREEIELSIPVQELSSARLLLEKLLPDSQLFTTVQKRHDFRLGKVRIALKHSADWGYHIEFEILVDIKERVSEVETVISKVAQQLNVELLTPTEEKEFVEKQIAERRA